MIKSLLQQPTLFSVVTNTHIIIRVVKYLLDRLLYIALSMSVINISFVTYY